MLECLNTTIKKLNIVQESCDQLIQSISCLLETNTVAEVAVKPNAFGHSEEDEQEKKSPEVLKKEKELQKTKVDVEKKKLQSMGEEGEDEPEVDDVEVDDGEEGESVDDTEVDDSEEDPADFDPDKEIPTDIARIRRSLDALEDEDLKSWVSEYFQAKVDGNTGEASVLRKKIDQRIDIRNLDRETVYHGQTEKELISNKETEQGD
jgi:hypothetical protein